MRRPLSALLTLSLLSACGGGGGGGSGSISAPSPTPTPTPVATSSPTPTASTGCSLRERQDWALAQLREWYLFPETLPASLDPTPYTSVDTYLDALTATARSQRRDRYFTYVTSIAGENAYYSSGQTAGFGFRLTTNAAQRRVVVAEAFEGTPALGAGIDRGTEILAIGPSEAFLRPVSEIIAASGSAGVTQVLGPDTPGTTRVFRISDPAAGTKVVTVAKANYELIPVSSRYGAKIIEDGAKKVGYINLRTFISTADPALRQAFAQFRTAGVTELILDLRYNGGGLVSIANLLGDLMGGNRTGSDVFSYTAFNPSKSAENSTRYFQPQLQSIGVTKVAFIGLSGTASASELVTNAFIPYLRANAALVGTNTYGKPVGQIALDRAGCDDRLRVVAFATQNAARQGAYFDGLAGVMERTCSAADDLSFPLGDPREGSTRVALDFLAGRSCSPISSAPVGAAARMTAAQELLTPERPSTVQREVPGLF